MATSSNTIITARMVLLNISLFITREYRLGYQHLCQQFDYGASQVLDNGSDLEADMPQVVFLYHQQYRQAALYLLAIRKTLVCLDWQPRGVGRAIKVTRQAMYRAPLEESSNQGTFALLLPSAEV